MCVLCIPDGSTEPVSPLETSPGELCVSLSNFQHLSSNLRSSLSPLASALTGFAPASPLESHTFKTKDLKPFRFIHFQKKEGGPPSCAPQLILRLTEPCAIPVECPRPHSEAIARRP